MCSGSTAIPRGRVESRAWAARRGNEVSTLSSTGRTSQPHSPRLPAKPSILRGESSRAPGLSGAGTSFSGRARVADAEPDPLALWVARLGSQPRPSSSARQPVRRSASG